MMIHCPSCGTAFDMPDEVGQVKATATCHACGRVVVARDTDVVPSSPGEQTTPFDPLTLQAEAQGERTVVAGRGPSLSLPRNGRVSIAVLSGPQAGDVVVLQRARVVLGRTGGGADVEVNDPEVSRRHAAIECYGGTVVLKDQGSRNGTYVGMSRIETRVIEDHTEFRLGSTRFVLIVTENG